MSRKGFVDKNLFGLKDRLRNHPTNENEKKAVTTPVSNPQAKEQTNKEKEFVNAQKQLNKKPDSPRPESKQIVSEILPPQAKKDTATIDKEYFKALLERKKEFFHKRSDILKRIKLNLEKLPIDIERHEKQLAESRKTKEKLVFLVEEINTLNEKEWDKKDFSLDLANAMKKVENTRLELFTLQQKTNCLLEDDIPGLEKNRHSFIPELTSLSPGQIFKLGLSFFFPLIIGLLLTGILISIAMFIAMGVI